MKINSEIQIKNNIPEQKGKSKKYVVFSSARSELQRESRAITMEFLKTQPWYVRLAHKFSDKKYKGDVANIIITGIGTGTVAPIMIKYNPLAKEDKDTKTYAAWRQPISAVIAVVTQVGINMQVRKIIEKLAAQGKLGEKYDTRISDELMKEIERIKIKYSNETKTKEHNKTVKEISKRIDDLKKQVVKITKRVDNFRDNTGIGIALATLPLACWFLNWSYPRFMKLAFPSLSDAKNKNTKENNDYNVAYADKLKPKAGA